MAYQPAGDRSQVAEQWIFVDGQDRFVEGGCAIFRREQSGPFLCIRPQFTDPEHCDGSQEEDFDEDEGIYDELNLDEEEEKFGLAADDDESDESDGASEGVSPFLPCVLVPLSSCRRRRSATTDAEKARRGKCDKQQTRRQPYTEEGSCYIAAEEYVFSLRFYQLLTLINPSQKHQ